MSLCMGIQFLLSDEEEETVYQLFEERYNRMKLKMSGDEYNRSEPQYFGVHNHS